MPLALRDVVLQPPQQRRPVTMAGAVGSRSAYGGSRGITVNIRFPDDTEKVLAESGVCWWRMCRMHRSVRTSSPGCSKEDAESPCR